MILNLKSLLAMALMAATQAHADAGRSIVNPAELTPAQRIAAESTGLLLEPRGLVRNEDGTYRLENASGYPDLYKLTFNSNHPDVPPPEPPGPNMRNEICADEELIRDGLNSIQSAFCSSVFIGGRYMLTAAHCLEHLQSTPNRKIRVVFGTYANSQSIPAENVYEFSFRDVTASHYRVGVTDYAIVALDRPVTGREAPPISTQSPVSVGQKLQAFGHPFGFPMTRSEGPVTQQYFNKKPEVNQYTTIETKMNITVGNSGGPIFDEEGRLVAILSRMELPHLVMDREAGCYRWNLKDKSKSREAKSMPVSLIRELIANPPAPPPPKRPTPPNPDKKDKRENSKTVR